MAIIGCDLDDVICDFIGKYSQMANARFGRPELGTAPVDWEWSNFGLSKAEQGEVWKDIKNTPHFWESLEMEEGFTRYMLRDLEAMHAVYYPTARIDTVGEPAAKQSARWVRSKTGIEFPAVFAAYNKAPLASVLKYDYFIDDLPKNCIEILTALPGCKVYLKDSSHNVGYVNSQLPRVATFDEFASIIMEGK